MSDKENDLCESCKYGDVCDDSTKTFSFCFTSICYKYEETENDKTN